MNNIYKIGDCDHIVARNEEEAEELFKREYGESANEYDVEYIKDGEMYTEFNGYIKDGELPHGKYAIHEGQLLVLSSMYKEAEKMIANGKEIPFILGSTEG